MRSEDPLWLSRGIDPLDAAVNGVFHLLRSFLPWLRPVRQLYQHFLWDGLRPHDRLLEGQERDVLHPCGTYLLTSFIWNMICPDSKSSQYLLTLSCLLKFLFQHKCASFAFLKVSCMSWCHNTLLWHDHLWPQHVLCCHTLHLLTCIYTRAYTCRCVGACFSLAVLGWRWVTWYLRADACLIADCHYHYHFYHYHIIIIVLDRAEPAGASEGRRWFI